MAKYRGSTDEGWGKVGMFVATRFTKLRVGEKTEHRGYTGRGDTVCRGKWNKDRCEVCRHRVDDHMVCKLHPDWEISAGLVCEDFKKQRNERTTK